MKTSLIALILVCGSLCGTASDAPKATDLAGIQGVWLAQTESQNGQKRAVDYQYVFKGDEVTFRDENGKATKYSFRLDTSSSLKMFIIQPAEKSANPMPVSIAYELAGDSLTIVIAPPGLRPTEISDKNNQELIVCKRKSP